MELGIYRLAEINKGGGLRQKAAGLATQYLNGVGDWVDMPTSMTPKAHNHYIPDLYCGVSDIGAGRILISGSGGSSNPTWMDAGTNGKILGWASGAPAWVDAPSGSSVSAANPTASVGLSAVDGSASTFMRSDAAPKLDVSISPKWTGTHTFSGPVQFNGGTNLTTGRVRNIRFMTESDDIDHTSGTDTLIIVTSSNDAVLTLPTSATTGDRIEFYSTLATASFDCASAKIWPINNSSGKVKAWGGGMGAPAYCFAIWDGTNWRVGYLSPGY